MLQDNWVPKFISSEQLIESDISAVFYDEVNHNIIIFEEHEWSICKLCNGATSFLSICTHLSEQYAAHLDVIKNDVSEFLEDLEKKGLVYVGREIES